MKSRTFSSRVQITCSKCTHSLRLWFQEDIEFIDGKKNCKISASDKQNDIYIFDFFCGVQLIELQSQNFDFIIKGVVMALNHVKPQYCFFF